MLMPQRFKNMKVYKHIFTLCFLFFFADTAFGQNAFDFKYLTKTSPSNQILMRWMPEDSAKWNIATQGGSFRLIRRKYSTSDTTGTPLETITTSNLKLISTDSSTTAWQANWNDLFYKLLFNAYYPFSTNPNPSKDNLISGALSERHFMASLAADLRYGAAKLAGLGYTDTNVSTGVFYTYRVELLNSSSVVQARYTSPPIQVQNTVLPQPKGLKTVKNKDSKGRVILKWGVTTNEEDDSERKIYAGYYIDRAEKLTSDANWGAFKRLTVDSANNSLPFINFTELNANYYSDSILNTTKMYRYKVTGISYFGDEVASATKDTTIYRELKEIPGFTDIERIGANYKFTWQFPIATTQTTEHLNNINGYVIQASKTDTLFAANSVVSGTTAITKTLTTLNIPASTIFNKLSDTTSSVYFRIGALGIGGDTTFSLAYIVTRIDRTPPAAPTGLAINTLKTDGDYRITLSWNANTDPDLLGYQVYRQVGTETEKIFLGRGIRKVLNVVDTLSLNMEFPQFKYAVMAYDSNYNESLPTYITHQKPDTRRPMPPIIKKHGYNSNGKLKLYFDQSPEKQIAGKVIRHEIVRKELNNSDCNFQRVKYFTATDNTIEWEDPTALAGKSYVYSVIAYDGTNNRSCFNTPNLAPAMPADTALNNSVECNCMQLYVVSLPDTLKRPMPTPFTAVALHSIKSVQINWGYTPNAAKEFEIYRAEVKTPEEKPSLLTVVSAGDTTAYSFVDEKVEFTKAYKYQIRSVTENGNVSNWKEVQSEVLKDLKLELDKYDLVFSNKGQSVSIAVTSNTSWQISTTDSTWLNRSIISGVNNGTFTLSVSANAGEERKGTIRISVDGIVREIDVRQAGVSNGTGLLAQYYNRISGIVGQDSLAIKTISPDLIRVEPTVNVNYGGNPVPGMLLDFMIIWEGYLEVPDNGIYTFYANMDDGMRAFINNEKIFDSEINNFDIEVQGIKTLELKAGFKYPIRIFAWDMGGVGAFRLKWSSNAGISKQIIPQQYLYPKFTPTANESDLLHNKCFVIRGVANDKVLQMMENYTTQFRGYTGNKDQVWKLEKVGDYYKVISMSDFQGKILEAFIPFGEHPAKIVSTGFFSDKISQKWTITPSENERFNFRQYNQNYGIDWTDEGGFTKAITFTGSYREFKFQPIGCPTNSNTLIVDKSSLVFGSAGGTELVNVTSSKFWSATVNENWINTSPYNAYGDKQISVTVPAYTATEISNRVTKFGIVSIKGEAASVTVSVRQTPPPNGTGLTARYFNTTSFSGMNQTTPAVTKIDPKIDFEWALSPMAGVNNDFSVRWEGYIEPPVSGNYTFYGAGDDGVRLWINSEQLIDDNTSHPETEFTATKTVYLQAGQKYSIKFEIWDGGYTGAARLRWSNDKGLSKQIVNTIYLYPQ